MRISSFFVLAGYLAANAYVAARTSVFLHRNLPERVAKLISLLTAGVYSVFAMGMPLAHILPEGTARKLILRVSFGFYGIFIYLFSAYVIIEVLARLSKRFHRTERLTARKGNPKLIFGGAVWFGIILTCLMGIHHASELTVKHYAVQTDKDGGGRDSLRVVLIADLHLGYSVGAERIADMVEKVNAQDADIILVAGDIFDNTVEGIDDPEAVKASLRAMKSRLGVYACWGNHDIDELILAGFTFDSGTGSWAVPAAGLETFSFVPEPAASPSVPPPNRQPDSKTASRPAVIRIDIVLLFMASPPLSNKIHIYLSVFIITGLLPVFISYFLHLTNIKINFNSWKLSWFMINISFPAIFVYHRNELHRQRGSGAIRHHHKGICCRYIPEFLSQPGHIPNEIVRLTTES